ncbi:MAG TPA: hypothetical protein PLL69_03935 [Gemmatimonadales bacterium]|nr:hypothetical protein [Gemmatimonadales bacterium]
MSDRPRFPSLVMAAVVLAACGGGVTTPRPDVPEPPGYSLSVSPAAKATIRPGEQLYLDLFIERETGFDGLINFSAEAPQGIVAIVQPRAIFKRDDTDLTIIADHSAPRRKHQVVFRGESEGLADRKVVVEVTVVD